MNISASGLDPLLDEMKNGMALMNIIESAKLPFLLHLTHHILLYFACHSERVVFHKPNEFRDFEMCDLPFAESAYILFSCGLGFWLENYPCTHYLSKIIIRHSNDLHVLNSFVSSQELLNLFGVNVLASSDDHVSHATKHSAVALLIHHRCVSSVHPSISVN